MPFHTETRSHGENVGIGQAVAVPEVILDPVCGIDDTGCRKVPLSSRFAGRVRDDKIFKVVLSASVSPW
jgi:hypothetical protein